MIHSAFAPGRSVTGGHQRTPGMAGSLSAFGRNGDTELAHVTPGEKAMLTARGGSGTINPSTCLPECVQDRGFGAGGEQEQRNERRGPHGAQSHGGDCGGPALSLERTGCRG